MHKQNDDIQIMIMDILKGLNIKPSKQSIKYTDEFIQSHGGYHQYFKEYKKQKAPIAPIILEEKVLDACENVHKTSKSTFKKEQSITPNRLKVPSVRPPPKPPAPKQNYQEMLNVNSNKLESTAIYSPNADTNLSFFITQNVK